MSWRWAEVWHYRKGSWSARQEASSRVVQLFKEPRTALPILLEHDTGVSELVCVERVQSLPRTYFAWPTPSMVLFVEGLV